MDILEGQYTRISLAAAELAKVNGVDVFTLNKEKNPEIYNIVKHGDIRSAQGLFIKNTDITELDGKW